jgi:hypothetical protein
LKPPRDDVLELIASAPAKGIPISAVLALPGAGSRDAVDHLLGWRPAAAGRGGAQARCVLARTVINQVTRRLRQHWPHTRMVWRGDGAASR